MYAMLSRVLSAGLAAFMAWQVIVLCSVCVLFSPYSTRAVSWRLVVGVF